MRDTPKDEPEHHLPEPTRINGLRIMGGLSIILLGLVGFYKNVLEPRGEEQARDNWTETTCTMTDSRVLEPNEYSDRCHLVVSYDYVVSGRGYEGGRASFRSDQTQTDCDWVADFHRRHPVGARVPCFYSPDHITGITLEREGEPLFGFGLLLLLLCPMGVAVMWAPHAARKRRQPSSRWMQTRTRARKGFSAILPLVDETRPNHWWTGIIATVTVAATCLLPSVSADTTVEGVGFAFVIVVITAVIAHAVFWHRVLGHLGPKLVVTTDPPTVLGQNVTIRVELRGLMPLWLIEARVVAREEADEAGSYHPARQHKVFFDRRVIHMERPGRSVSAVGGLDLPVDAVASFEGRGIAIRWVVKVRADIALWPDVNREYELRVDSRLVLDD